MAAAAPALTSRYLDPIRLGVLLLIATEATFFVFLISGYVYYRVMVHTTPTAAQELDPFKTGLFSIALFASSATMGVAHRRVHHPQRRGLALWLGLTIVLGATFLLGQGLEYVHLYRQQFTIARNVYGSSFFTLTGFHGLHVFAGLLILLTLTGLVMADRRHAIPDVAFDAAAYYWHFVDAVWVVIFTLVYLVK